MPVPAGAEGSPDRNALRQRVTTYAQTRLARSSERTTPREQTGDPAVHRDHVAREHRRIGGAHRTTGIFANHTAHRGEARRSMPSADTYETSAPVCDSRSIRRPHPR